MRRLTAFALLLGLALAQIGRPVEAFQKALRPLPRGPGWRWKTAWREGSGTTWA